MKRSLYRYNDRAVRIARILRMQWGLAISLLLLISCKTAQPITTAQRSEQQTRNLQLRDSVVIRDSIVITYRPGSPSERGLGGCPDTIYCDRWHDRWQVQRFERTDTLYRDREVITQLPPERYIPPWAWWCLGICIALALLLVVRIILRIQAK